ncbi:MMPL family transporter [Mycolicibacter heraklionensis]|uniref:MMPL family transporter n=1 Tax=Mycolicibacter heraklionensis TaxID=512402 RepID=A0A9X7ZGL6_9MYCO|nr:MMPL family transporter [Mycolicibacter heraklionensis]QZA10161.1 MMPL family transporter [Mycolicibacter heraklionensis]
MSSGAGSSRFARVLYRFPVPIIVGWLLLTVAVNVVVPPLEVVGNQNLASLTPQDAPSMVAIKQMGRVFGEFDSDGMAMLVLEGQQELGDVEHRYYDGLIRALEADTVHVAHVQNFWGDLTTAAGAQSADGKAAYTQVHIAGDQGSTLSNESVSAIRDIVGRSDPPPGLGVYVTGPAPLEADMDTAGDKSMTKMTVITVAVITLMLLIVYRSIITTLLVLALVFIELSAGRGVVAIFGYHHVVGLSIFVVTVLTPLAIAAGTDYAIFLVGRYQEARQAGEDRQTAFYSTYRGVAHVIAGSGLTVAGAMVCLRLTRLNYFSSMGIPCAIGLLVVLAAALTLGPAILVLASRFGLLESKRPMRTRGWRRLGTAIVRWPTPILVCSLAVTMIGLLALPGYRTSYDSRHYVPAGLPSNIGYAAAERHFTAARMNPDLLMVHADHDMRNPADMLVLERIAKNIFRLPGIARVQAITRPLGAPIEHSSIPFQVGMQAVPITQNLAFLNDRLADMRTMTDDLGVMIVHIERMYELMVQLNDITHRTVGDTEDMAAVTTEIRDLLAVFDDTWRPVRNYFYWEPGCFNIPLCQSLRSSFDALDGVDRLTEQVETMLGDLEQMDALMPQLLSQLPPTISIAKSIRGTAMAMYATFSSMITQMERMTDTGNAMGQAFDDARNDDFFYLPPEAFDNPDFQRGMALLMSPDGAAARFIITHDVDPSTLEGISHVDAEINAARESVKGTPLAGAHFSLAGTAAMYKDIQNASRYDLMIAVIATIVLIFVVMLIITRALVAAFVIVATVVLSLAASFGLSVLLWQHLLGTDLHWMTLVFAIIILLAVGSDYNLLLVARLKEELPAGINTAIIRAMGGTGGVVTAAGLVFAFTMASMITSDLRSIGQIGIAIGLGLLFDTLIVRALMTPSIAAKLGHWFWWPMNSRRHYHHYAQFDVRPRSTVRF